MRSLLSKQLACLFALLLTSSLAGATDDARLITFGTGAKPSKGDDDFTEVVYLRVPRTTGGSLSIRIFDPDVGGAEDEPTGPWNTRTRFSLFGGQGAYSAAGPAAAAAAWTRAGSRLATAEFGEDPGSDGVWVTLATLKPEQGELDGEDRVFRLVVEGLEGDDGNQFNLTVSRSPDANEALPGATLTDYRPTLSVPPGADRFLEARLWIPPATTELRIRQFDMDQTPSRLEIPFEPVRELQPSGEADWRESLIRLAPEREARFAAVVIRGGRKLLNDVVLEGADQSGAPLAFHLPALLVPAAVPPDPQADTSIRPDCRTVDFDAGRSHGRDDRLRAFRWDFGDGQHGEGMRIAHRYAGPGSYPAVLTVIDDSDRTLDRARRRLDVKVNQPPTAVPGPERVAAPGEPIVFDGKSSSDRDGQLVGFDWDFGDGQRAQGARVTHGYREPGRYQAALRVRDDGPGPCTDGRASTGVWINAQPRAEAGTDQRVAVGEPAAFDASGSHDSDGNLRLFRWDFGDGQQGDGPAPKHAYSAPGRYRVLLTVEDDAGVANSAATDESSVWVNAPPLADAGPDQLVTVSDVRFDGAGSRDPDGEIRAWEWDFGDGSTGTGPAPSHVYAAPGVYAVRLTVTDDSGTSSSRDQDELVVRVNASPVADAGPDRLVAPGQSIAFEGSGSSDPDGRIAAYAWDFGDGATASGPAPSHRYERPGRYQVRLQVQDDTGQPGAVAFADALIRVNAPPVAVAGNDQVVAPGQPVTLDGGASYDPDGQRLSYRWTFSDGGTPMDGASVSRSFPQPGSYSAQLEVMDDSGAANGRAEDRLTIRVNHAPVAVPNGVINACEGMVELDGGGSTDADGDRLSHGWDFGDGGSASGPRVSRQFVQGGRFPVVLKVDDGTGLANATNEASTEVWIHRRPEAVAEAPSLACAGDVVLFNGVKSKDPDHGRLLYDWDFGDGTRAQAANPAKVFGRGGVYAVSLRVKDDSGLTCDEDVDRLALSVVDAPVANAGEDMTACANTPLTFDGTGSRDFDGVVNAYSWDFGDGTQGGGPNPTHLYTAPGDYQVTLSITGDQVGQCDNHNSDQLRVRVLSAPEVTLQAPEEAALGAPVSMKAVLPEAVPGQTQARLAYRWDFGDGARADGESVHHNYRKPGRYQVVLTADDGTGGACGQFRRVHPLLVNAPPRASAGADRIAAPGESLLFDGSASADPDGAISRYQWDFGDGGQAEGIAVSHKYQSPGVYNVSLTVTDNSDLENRRQTDQAIVRCNAPPSPEFTLEPAALCAGEEGAFDGAASSDRDGTLRTWLWDFGDGSQARTQRARHRYRDSGRYRVTLAVSDGTGVANAVATLAREVLVNRPPEGAIAKPLHGCPGEPVRFASQQALDPDGGILSYRWEFGDGGSGEGQSTSHVYATAGDYPVRLEMSDDSGSACATTVIADEARINAAPMAKIQVESKVAYVGGAHDGILFDASASSDADGEPLVYRWDFGDGVRGRGPRVRHAFEKAGRYRVTLEVQDDSRTNCATSTATVEIDARAGAERPR